MKFNGVILIILAIILFVFSHYVDLWYLDFVDPCCNGLCGRCPPSFWECSFMGIVCLIQIIIGAVLLWIGSFMIIDSIPGVKKDET